MEKLHDNNFNFIFVTVYGQNADLKKTRTYLKYLHRH